MIAVMAAIATGDPSKYCSMVGAAFKTCLGKSTRAIVRIIGKPMT